MKKKTISSIVKTLFPYSILILFGIYAMWSLTIPGLYKGHDSPAHISRFIAFEQALLDGQFPPRWAGYFFGGIGSPVLNLNYTLPYFAASIIHHMGFSLFDSYKLTLGITYIASGIAAYFAFKTLFGKTAGFVGATLYMWAPYRFVDIFVRSAFGESVSFVFPPLILLAIHKRKWWLLIISFAGLFLTHPVMSALFCLFFFPYALLYFYQEKQVKSIFPFVGSFVLVLGIAAFNIIPSLLETAYTHFSPSSSDPLHHFPTFMQLLRSPWGYGYSETNDHDWLSFQLGVAQWVVLVISVVLLGKQLFTRKKDSLRLCGAFVLISAAIVIFFMIPSSASFWKVLHLSTIIDFPWRMIVLVVFFAAYLGAWLIYTTKGAWRLLWIILFIGLALYGNRNHLRIIEILPYTETYFRQSDQTGDDWGEYASIYRQTRTITRLPERIQVLEGRASIEAMVYKSHYFFATIHATTSATLRINVMYFPGWRVWVDNKELAVGERCTITKTTEKTVDTSGLIRCRIPAGNHLLSVRFMDTPLRRVSNLITLVSFSLFLCLLFRWLYLHIMRRKTSFPSSAQLQKSSSKRKIRLK